MAEAYYPYLQHLTYALFFASIVAYAALDGFDLGVGCIHLFSRTDRDRRIFLNAIGPVWDGNSVWVVIAGGVLFAGFPLAFSALLPGLYLPSFALILGFLFRGAAMEFRSKKPWPWWRATWDVVFSGASFLLSINLGMIMGSFIGGFPLNAAGEIVKAEFQFVSPYNLIVGFMTVALFMMHGAIYLTMKTEGVLRKRVQSWVTPLILYFVTLWILTSLVTYLEHPFMFDRFFEYPWLIVIAIASGLVILSIIFWESREYYGLAFLSSSLAIASLVTLVGIGLYPYLLRETGGAQDSLTLYNASSSPTTLGIIAIVAMAGLPLSLGYLTYLYRTFRGTVTLGDASY